jgi:very-short-patch-repair endonuclease
MSRNQIIPYDPSLRIAAREMRRNPTKAELRLWRFINRKKLQVQFHRQVPIDRFIVDFYCHELKLAIEVDGGYHQNPEQQIIDSEKDERLTHFGIHVIRFKNEDIFFNHESVIYTISQVVSNRIKSTLP